MTWNFWSSWLPPPHPECQNCRLESKHLVLFGAGGGTQGLLNARQTPCQWATSPSNSRQIWPNLLIMGRTLNSSVSKPGTLRLRKMIKCPSQAAPWTWKQNLLGSPIPLASAHCQVWWLCGSFCLQMGVCLRNPRFCPVLPSSWRHSCWPCVGTSPLGVCQRWLSWKLSFLFTLKWDCPFPLALRAHLHTYVCAHGRSGFHPPIT